MPTCHDNIISATMTQEELWDDMYRKVTDFMNANRRTPSRHTASEAKMANWMKRNKQRLDNGTLLPRRQKRFCKVLAKAAMFRRVNQYAYAESSLNAGKDA